MNHQIKKPFVTVSVVITTYNHANYIKKCLNSILSQTTSLNYEILIGEDNSNDGTREICQEYATKYPDKIKLFLRDRKDVKVLFGKPVGMNNYKATLKEATGKYIAICEGDDYWTDPQKLDRQINFLESNLEFTGCFHNVSTVDQDNNIITKNFCDNDRDVFNLDACVRVTRLFPTCSMFFRSSVLDGKWPRWFEERTCDQFLDFMISKKGLIGYLDYNMGAYRHHSGGVWSGSNKLWKLKDRFFRLELILEDNYFTDLFGPYLFEKIVRTGEHILTDEDLKLDLRNYYSAKIAPYYEAYNIEKGFAIKDYEERLVNKKKLIFLQKRIATESKTFKLLHDTANVAWRLRDWETSLTYWDQLFEISESSAYLYIRKGNCLLRLEKLGQAKNLTDAGLKLYANNEHLLDLKQRILQSQKTRETSIRSDVNNIESKLAEQPDDFHLNHDAALGYGTLQEWDSALKYWNKLFRISEHTVYLYLKKGNCLLQLNKSDEAIALAIEGIQLYPQQENTIHLLNQILSAHDSKDDPPRLVATLNKIKALPIDGSLSKLIDKKIGDTLFKYSDLSMAVEHHLRCFELYDGSADFMSQKLLKILYNQGLVDNLIAIDEMLVQSESTQIKDLKLRLFLQDQLNTLKSIFIKDKQYFDFGSLDNSTPQVSSLSQYEKSNAEALMAVSQSEGHSLLDNILSLYHLAIKDYKCLINTNSSAAEIIELSHWLKDRIRQRIPTSFIRLGDGEGCFLSYHDGGSTHQKKDQEFILELWWGKMSISTETKMFLQSQLEEAIVESDLLGIPSYNRIQKDLQCYLGGGSDRRVYRSISAIYNFLTNHNDQISPLITSCHLHTDWENFDLYRMIFEDLDSCGVISCHAGIATILSERYGISDVELFKIPGEYHYAEMWDGKTEESHLNDYFPRLRDQQWEAGKVYLVAAGYLGKLYCHYIKAKGGIAIDIGAIVDYWCGYKTRDFHDRLGLPGGIKLKDNIERCRII